MTETEETYHLARDLAERKIPRVISSHLLGTPEVLTFDALRMLVWMVTDGGRDVDAQRAIAHVLAIGDAKHGNTLRDLRILDSEGDAHEAHIQACERHLLRRGEIDPETGVDHIYHAAARAVIALHLGAS